MLSVQYKCKNFIRTTVFISFLTVFLVFWCVPNSRADAISTVDVHCVSCLAQSGIAIVTTANGVTRSVVDNLGGFVGQCDTFCLPGATDAHGNAYEATLFFSGFSGLTGIGVQVLSGPIVLPSLAVGQTLVESYPVTWSGVLDTFVSGSQLSLTGSGTGTATFTFVGVLGGPLDGTMTKVLDAKYDLIATPEPASISLVLPGMGLIAFLYNRYRMKST